MSGTGRALALLTVLALGGCALPRPAAPPPAGAETLMPAQLVAAVQRDADRIDHTRNASDRSQLLAAASADAQRCMAATPDRGDCHYAQALVLGLMARDRPVKAASLLKEMLAELGRAEALDPTFDHAGPARLSATVLTRAPGWPLGPGDPDAAVLAAQRAVDRDPTYPPNLIALAEAQEKTQAPAAHATFERARLAVQAWSDATPAGAAARADWQRQVQQGLQAPNP